MPIPLLIPAIAAGGGLFAGFSLSDGFGQLLKVLLLLGGGFVALKVTGVL